MTSNDRGCGADDARHLHVVRVGPEGQAHAVPGPLRCAGGSMLCSVCSPPALVSLEPNGRSPAQPLSPTAIWAPQFGGPIVFEILSVFVCQVFLAAWIRPYANDQAEILDVVEALGRDVESSPQSRVGNPAARLGDLQDVGCCGVLGLAFTKCSSVPWFEPT